MLIFFLSEFCVVYIIILDLQRKPSDIDILLFFLFISFWLAANLGAFIDSLPYLFTYDFIFAVVHQSSLKPQDFTFGQRFF